MINIHNYSAISYDTETTGLNYPVDKVFGFSIATPNEQEYHDIRREPNIIGEFMDQMLHYRGKIVCHNASFDYRMSAAAGIYLPIGQLDDTVIRSVQINEHERSYALDDLGKKYIGEGKLPDIWEELARIFGGAPTRNIQAPNLQRACPKLVGAYCNQDAVLTLKLWHWQRVAIEYQGLQDICEFERDKMPTFIRAEMRGIRVDLEHAKRAMDKLKPIICDKQRELNKLAGDEVNVNSSPQVKALFHPKEDVFGNWYTDDGTMIGRTPKGKPSLKAEYLMEMKDPKAKLISEIRSLIKTHDVFLGKHIIEHAVGGRVYPGINQSKGPDGGTKTGRLSYVDPALQQIPDRKREIAAIVKPCFLPDEGCSWVDGDEASFEVRIFAHLINNPVINNAYYVNPSLDLHRYVADLTGLPRKATYSGQPNAKQLNLSMIFNSGDGAIADKMGLPWKWVSFLPRGKEDKKENYITYKKAGLEAKLIIAKYHERIPGVKKLANNCKLLAEQRGYIFTYTGRRLRFPRGYKSYSASGLLIQATAADRNKENWKLIEEELGDEGELILNTHDSYGMSIVKGCEEKAWKRVKNALDKSNFRVPLILDFNGQGINWWDAIKDKK